MKKIKVENLIYLFIIVSPFLDASSFLIKQNFPSLPISPTLIIRPIIPLILLAYIFFSDKSMRKKMIITTIIYIIYFTLHMYNFNNIKTGIAYGSFINEAQYVINYTFNIFLLIIIIYFKQKRTLPFLKKSLFIMLCEYLIIIYISILTGTSYSTYVEGIGYKSWFISGNSIGSILLLLYSTLIMLIENKKRFKYIIAYILLGVYLIFLIGTRTGLYGFFLVSLIYIIYKFGYSIYINNKVNIKKNIPLVAILLMAIIFVGIFGSSTISRRKFMNGEVSNIIDVNTGKYGHTTGDTGVIVSQIKNNQLDDVYMSEAQKKAYISMYEYANKNKISANDTRKQQLSYHYYLFKYQNNILSCLFGNGYLNHYGEMILEMEIPSLLFNFGIVGMVIFLMPYIYLIVKSIKKYNNHNIMHYATIGLGLGLSFLAGYVFYSTSCALVIICNIVLLDGEV